MRRGAGGGGPNRPLSVGKEPAGGLPLRAVERSPSRARSQGPSGSEPRDRRSNSQRRDHSSSSSSSSSTDSRSRGSPPTMSEQQYEEEMYRRLKSELSSDKDPKEREERIAKHIREMAKLSPVLFRHFMAKNAGNLSAMALIQQEQGQQQQESGGEALPSQLDPTQPGEAMPDSPNSRPLRSILKRKPNSGSPSPERSPSPLPPPQSALSQIEKVIQTLRKGGVKQEEKTAEKDESAPPPSGALRQLSSYMDIEDEEEYLYGNGPRKGPAQPQPESQSGPFWSAHRFEEKPQPGGAFRPLGGASQLDQKRVDPAPMAGPPSAKQHPFDMFEDLTAKMQKTEPPKGPLAFGTFEEKEKSYEQWRAAVFQKPEPEKPKESAPAQSSEPEGKESAEQLSSTVENILKSIGFNFELSQRMQELARQKKEGEQEAILINQSASFLGSADSDALTEDLTHVLQKEPAPVPPPAPAPASSPAPAVTSFLKEVEAATKVAREKALKAKEAEKRHIRGPRNPSVDKDLPRGRDSGGKERGEAARRTRRDSEGAEALSRFSGPGASDHSPYDPSVQDYQHQPYQPATQPPYAQFGYSDYELYQDNYFQDPHQPKPVRTSNLIALGGEGGGLEDSGSTRPRGFPDPRHPDYDRRDRSTDDTSFKKSGERVLIVKKQEDKDRVDSPGSDTSFSRRIVLPPKEKGKAPQREGKRHGSPESPRRSKHSRRSPLVEDRPSDRIIFQKSKASSTRQPEPSKSDSYRKIGRSPSPQLRLVFENKYKYLAPKGEGKTVDPKAKPEPSKPQGRSMLEFLKTKIQQELPKPDQKAETLKAEVARATKVAEDKVRLLARKKKLVTLEKELAALRQQHNELLRKRRRQKDGHRDPLLTENTKLQDEISAQIKLLREGKDLPTADLPASSHKGSSAPSDVVGYVCTGECFCFSTT